jgi:hypothetical protein
MPTKLKSRKPIESSLFNGILTKILTTPKKQRKYLRKLEKLMQSCQIKINVRFLTNTAKKDSIHQLHHNNVISRVSEAVSLTST